MKKPMWFKAKRYGFGWYPATWQGWLVITVFVVLIVADFYRLEAASLSHSDALNAWVKDLFVLVMLVTGVAWLTGEKPRWRWGKD